MKEKRKDGDKRKVRQDEMKRYLKEGTKKGRKEGRAVLGKDYVKDYKGPRVLWWLWWSWEVVPRGLSFFFPEGRLRSLSLIALRDWL
jgi:hypothetical protein